MPCFRLSGAHVAVNGRRPDPVRAVVDAIEGAGGSALAVPGDCGDPSVLNELTNRVHDDLGPIDILCAFAGGGRPPQPIAEISDAEWRNDVDSNMTTTFVTIRGYLPSMMQRREGSIITMASGAARQPGGAPIGYAAAKAGIVNLTQQVAVQAGPAGIRVNCISPAAVLTQSMATSVPEERQRQLVAAYHLGRLGQPDDVAAAALFLASSASAWITGVTLDVAGGQIIR